MSGEAFDEVFDVVVVGSGAAGSAAALEAQQGGADVLVVEKCDQGSAGGNTRVSGGGWWVNRDPERARIFLRALSGSFPVADDVVDTWATETAEISTWLKELGADVAMSGDYHTDPEYLSVEGSDSYAGMDTIEGRMGNGLLHAFLISALLERGIEIRFGTPATRLIVESGGVVGVEVGGVSGSRRIGARGGVVLATGGFQADTSMVRDYLRIEDHVLWGSPASTGDGHRMAQAVGADLWHMGNMMSITGVRDTEGVGHYLALWNAHNYLWVGDDGRRFVDETAPPCHGHTLRGGSHELFPLRPFHLIFDEQMRAAGPLSPAPDVLPVGWNLLMNGSRWSADNSDEVEKGSITSAESIKVLAEKIGLDASTLERTVECYNTSCAEGRDDHFARDPGTLGPVVQGPFYALKVTPLLGWTNGGPRRDGRARVLDTRGDVIEGLYAAGEISSTYSWRKDGGFHIGDALAFGRVAGRDAGTRA
ncbi:succinate dehydrogenase/fumarate reductase flavoprotein subunit [Rhodococcus sp. SMB37]|uniref:FAD-dependent oxidoreductase n=1 Tax=Rhodococcus sp. SMB37 TaxID=2512213 RepID=UPI00105085E2|nr:FAD-dependent oxidoreductase [Rhodococcus sp. SMB37]TCN57168.1 succinate dehydrogenase/fumarate reductase flavoprotein subunit [Rhodococcus sp. SMB37]